MNRSKILLVLSLLGLLAAGCKHEKNDVFPALDFIRGQVAAVDTAVYSIRKLVRVTDSTYDTTYIKRDEFRLLARDFLETPDISKTLGGEYTEQRMMNNELGQAVFIATTRNKELEVQRQEVRIIPGPPKDSIRSVYIEKFKSNADSSVIKRMTWYTDQSFQIVTITQGKNDAEKTSVVEVVWNQDN